MQVDLYEKERWFENWGFNVQRKARRKMFQSSLEDWPQRDLLTSGEALFHAMVLMVIVN